MSFFSSQISGAFRLHNGNTLICAGVHGELIEVTQSGEVVWKYVNPVTNTGILAQGERSALDHRGHNYNAVFKIERIAPNDKRVAGKTLKPTGVLERPPGQGTADTGNRDRRNDTWNLTLGKGQYEWLAETLRSAKAPYKFVFVHQLVGGSQGNGRGGVEFARFQEWGGYDYDERYVFQQKRPGWEKPIHELLKETGVSVVFHGHDHFYACQELDGIVYQLVPQPGRAVPAGVLRQAEDYGYHQGTILSSPGYIRVAVSPKQTEVAYVRFPFTRENGGAHPGEPRIAHSYTILPRKD